MADARSGSAGAAPVVQPCARCGARWAVQGKPLHWCPRCRGVLLSPAPVDAPAERRNYRWVARPPGRRSTAGSAQRRPASLETPRYTQIPRWGLRDRPPVAAVAQRGPLAGLTERLPRLLIATAIVFGASALAELGRYGILLRNRTRLIQPVLLWISDAAVYVFGFAALALALVSAVALVGWLADTRRAAFEKAGLTDPRSLRTLALGCLVPGANLVWPGVFLSEAARLRSDPRLLRVIRIWWAAWVLNGVMVVVAQLYRFADSLQVQADGVSFALLTDLAAAGLAVLSLWLVRAFAGLDVLGREETVSRWVIATSPAEAVIQPVRPGGGAPESAAADRVSPTAEPASPAADRASDRAVGNDEATTSNLENAEVLPK
ncbi:DUF4328 domain-containing protein [Nocardia jejuensis]|uniref:DUF4328 domain-containing protein n=1 Tax=Nocardia jejuensis TaxID=328049 RepID=UPI001FE0A276|nr:DUF4328 domain-containing protein [Nocardia jejuensis]